MIKKSTTIKDIVIPNDREYILLVDDILNHPKVSQMKHYIQHGDTSCMEHSINVSYLSYVYCKKQGLNSRAAARGGLLHDLFLYDWHCRPREKGERPHGFEHPTIALKNADEYFHLDDIEKNIILRHMWPLTLTPPKYVEAYIVVWFDKYCSFLETFHQSAITFDDCTTAIQSNNSLLNSFNKIRKKISQNG